MDPISRLRNFNPFARPDGKSTSKEPVIFKLGNNQAKVDLTEPLNQGVRKAHDSFVGVPHKIEEIVDLLVSPAPAIEETELSSRVRRINRINQISQAPTTKQEPRPKSSSVEKTISNDLAPKKEDISKKIQNHVPFKKEVIDSDDDD